MANKGIFIAENMASTTVGSLLRNGQSATELENGAVVTLGELVVGENELYKIGAVAAITDDVYLVDGVELQADEQLTKGLHDFVNPANKPVRLRKASKGDRFSISEASVTGAVKVGEVVEVPATGTKLVAKATATADADLVCTVVAKWVFGTLAVPMVRLEVK